MTKRVVIHVGPPKCGSTSLQLALRAARLRLRARGIAFPPADQETGEPRLDPPGDRPGGRPHHSVLAAALTAAEGPPVLARLLGAFAGSDAQLLVLSSENFIRWAPHYPADAFAALAGFAVELVLLPRARDRWTLSMYKHAVRVVRRRHRGSFEAWLADLPPPDRDVGNPDWAAGLERLAALTGGSARVLDLEDGEGRTLDSRVLTGTLLGVPLAEWDAEAPPPPAWSLHGTQARAGAPVNQSPSDAATLFLAMTDRPDGSEEAAAELLRAVAEHGFGDAAPSLRILSPERSKVLLAAGAADRAALGLAPAVRVEEDLPVRGTLTPAEWRAMAAALRPHLRADAAGLVDRAGRTVRELE